MEPVEAMDIDDDFASEAVNGDDNKYQKPNRSLKLLPYASLLDAENDEYLEKILQNITKGILCHDVQLSLSLYTKSLKGYMQNYGLKFSKELHVKLVRLYFELLTMESCPLYVVHEIADTLKSLLKKPQYLTNEDITLPWRPLYNAMDRFVYHRKCTISISASAKLETGLKDLVKHCNVYFGPNTLEEVIAEFKPLLCPSSPKMTHGLDMLQYFLPYTDPDSEVALNKFLELLLGYGSSWNNHPAWEWTLMGILGQAAWRMPGSFEWDPYLPLIYSRTLKSLQLPVHFKGQKNAPPEPHPKTFDAQSTARWIISTLGNRPNAMKNLKNFLETVETYYNPLNIGRWSGPLASLLNEMVNCFNFRLKRERYLDSSKRWWERIPEDRKLTENDIDEFVKITSELVLDFYLDLTSGGFILKHLSIIRPGLIIPAVLEKYESLVETVTEPRKFLIAMRWVMVVLLPMVNCRKETDNYDGRRLLVPFAFSILPCFDPNDIMKTLSALGVIHSIFNLIPFVDCSSLSDDLTDEDERDACVQTGCLEDFAIQFLDKILSLIENRTLEHTRMADSRVAPGFSANSEDLSLEKFLWAVFNRLAVQSSTQICKSLARKIVSFALSSTLETDVSGKLFASVCQAISVARPDVMLPKLLPQLCSLIQHAITPDVLDDEELDKTLLFHLLLFSFIMESNGVELLKYKKDIESTFQAILKLNGKKAYRFSSTSISKFLKSLVDIYPLENRISESDYDDPAFLAINDWGIFMDRKDIKPKWHVPSIEELEWAKKIFLGIFSDISNKYENMSKLATKDDQINATLLKNINILQASLEGVQMLIPFWDTTPIALSDSVMDLSPEKVELGIPSIDISLPNTNQNVKERYFQMYSDIMDYLDNFKSDDTDVYIALLRGFDSLLYPQNETERRISLPIKTNTGASFQNTLDPKKKTTRGAYISQTYSIHLIRVRHAACSTWTKSHIAILEKLFEMCVNRYARVRVNSQARFCRVVDSYGALITRTISHLFLKKLVEGVPHDEYKGTLYTMLTCKASPVIINTWAQIRGLWVAVLHSPFSEKNSIIKCMDALRKIIAHSFVFFPLQEEISWDAKRLAKDLWTDDKFVSLGSLTPLDSSGNIDIYNNFVLELLESAKSGENHWRQRVMAMVMLNVLIVEQVPVPKKVVEFFFESLISSSVDMRTVAHTTICWLLTAFKRTLDSVNVNTKDGLILQEGESIHSVLQYKSDPSRDAIRTGKLKVIDESGRDVPEFCIHRTYYGFSGMPAVLKVKLSPTDYSNLENQPEYCKVVLEVSQNYFENLDYVTKLIHVWTQEEKCKGINSRRSQILKLLTRNNGPNILKVVLPMIHSLGVDKDQWKQRCAADILSGIISGVKVWDTEKTNMLWGELMPILNDCLDNVTQETMAHWGVGLGTANCGRDPTKMRFYIEFMKQRFVKSLETSQTTSVEAFKDMHFFDNIVANLSWRGGEIFVEILNFVKIHFLDIPIPYLNVRDQLGRLLGDVFEWSVDSSFGDSVELQCQISPKYEPFVESIFGALENLVPVAATYLANDKDSPENVEARKLLLKFKTALEWILSVCWDSETSVPPILYRFIPILCHFENYDPDPEVAQLCGATLSGLARTLILPKDVNNLLDLLNEGSASTSWKARLCVMEFVKVFALNNTNIFASSEDFSKRIISLVLKLLSDRKLEVRELSGKVLSGFLHCLIVQNPKELLSEFLKKANAFGKRRQEAQRKVDKIPLTPEEMDNGHSAVLGLCSFVDTHPYDVPDYLPRILVVLSTHLHDPEPVPGAVRKCLSNFRRTHHDNWATHKTQFSEDQLYILTDIFVSPCYYA